MPIGFRRTNKRKIAYKKLIHSHERRIIKTLVGDEDMDVFYCCAKNNPMKNGCGTYMSLPFASHRRLTTRQKEKEIIECFSKTNITHDTNYDTNYETNYEPYYES
jgi:hypothetical protein